MSIKTWVAGKLRKKRPARIQIEFTLDVHGRYQSEIKMTKSIPVTVAQRSLDKLKNDLTTGLTNKVKLAGFQHNVPGKGQFIRSQTIGDILK